MNVSVSSFAPLQVIREQMEWGGAARLKVIFREKRCWYEIICLSLQSEKSKVKGMKVDGLGGICIKPYTLFFTTLFQTKSLDLSPYTSNLKT